MPPPRAISADDRAKYHHGDLRRSLVEAALALVAEKQGWDFSLREVARRAGVSHNAPYNHFADKRDLLAAVAQAGFESLHERLRAVADGPPDTALVAIGAAYVRFGTENPAHYRLMFGPALVDDGPPTALLKVANASKSVLAEVIARGAGEGIFAARADDGAALNLLVLSAWSIVHGLTLLLADGLAGGGAPFDMGEHVGRELLAGLKAR
jgi:AcrR family transcriptional regulator